MCEVIFLLNISVKRNAKIVEKSFEKGLTKMLGFGTIQMLVNCGLTHKVAFVSNNKWEFVSTKVRLKRAPTELTFL